MNNYSAFKDNLPAGFDGIEGEELEIYVLEVDGRIKVGGHTLELHGEIEVEGYGEEDVELEFKQHLEHYLTNSYLNGRTELLSNVGADIKSDFEENLGEYLVNGFYNGDIEIV